MAEKPSQAPAEPPAVANASLASTANSGATASKTAAVEQHIDPWSVSAAVDDQGNTLSFDYEAISKKWSTSLIDQALLERFERLTGHKPHRWLRRGLFFSHRDFNNILDRYEKGQPFFLYTGRGPSSGSMHIGHTIPFAFTKWLQDVFDCPLVIMLTDDEKFLFKDNMSVEEAKKFADENAMDIISMGFDQKKTFIYSDFRYIGGHFYENSVEFSKLLPFNQVRGAFGFDNSTNTGRIDFPSKQCVAAFATSYPHIWGDDPYGNRVKRTATIPCLIPCAIDQDPYFRLLRENAHRMKNPSPKAALIHSKFLTALQGPGGKMSASDPTSAIFMSDTKKDVQKKINKFAFSGGRTSAEEHRMYGGNPDVDVPFQYLTYFLDDDAEIERLRAAYKSGEMLTGEMKQYCIRIMQEYVEDFQTKRKQVTPDVLKEYMTPRRLQWGGNPNPVKPPQPQGGKGSKGAAQPPPAASKSEQPSTATLVDRSTAPAAPAMLASGLGNQADNAPLQAQLPAETQQQQQQQQPSESSQSQSQPPPQQPAATHLPIFASTQAAEPQESAQSSASASGTATPQRPGLANVGRQSTTYGVSGLSSLSKKASSLIYGDD